jgi:hypothetical protein
MQKRDRFMLEEMMMQCWHVTDDIETVLRYMEKVNIPAKDKDVLMNMLHGMQAIYHQRFSDTMDLFGEMIRNKQITLPEDGLSYD